MSRWKQWSGIASNTSALVGHTLPVSSALPLRPENMTSSPYTTSGCDVDGVAATDSCGAIGAATRTATARLRPAFAVW